MTNSKRFLLGKLTGTETLLERFEQFSEHMNRLSERVSGLEANIRQLGEEKEAATALLERQLAATPGPAFSMPIVTLGELRAMRNRVHAEAAIRGRCMVVPIDPSTALCRILGRYKMFVDLRDEGFAPHLMFEGYWEYWLTEFIWRNLKPGQVALDVGANHGYYSVLMADLVGADGAVHAFEPNPRMFELLGRTAALNGFWNNVTVHRKAIAERPGAPMRFLATEKEPKNGRLLAEGETAPSAQAQGTQLYQVDVTSMDDAVPGPVDFVKIDVEGAEELAWRGMQRLIDRNPNIRIVMEFNPARCQTPRETLDSIAARFALREVDFEGLVVPCSAGTVLSRQEDTLLYLSNVDPD